MLRDLIEWIGEDALWIYVNRLVTMPREKSIHGFIRLPIQLYVNI